MDHVQNHGLQPRLFAQIRPIFNLWEYTRNLQKESRKESEINLEGLGGVSESLERFPELAKIAHFQKRGLQSGLFAQKRPIFDTCGFPLIDTNSRARSKKSPQKGLGGVSESLERFPSLTKIGHVQNHGLQPRLFAQRRPIFDPWELTRNRHKQSHKEIEITLKGFKRHSKPWAIAQAFCSNTANFRPFCNSPAIDTNSRARSQKSLQKGLGGVSESLERFPGLAKISHVQNHGLQRRLFAEIQPIFDPCNLPPIDTNSRARSQKSSQKGLGGVSESLERFPGLT